MSNDDGMTKTFTLHERTAHCSAVVTKEMIDLTDKEVLDSNIKSQLSNQLSRFLSDEFSYHSQIYEDGDMIASMTLVVMAPEELETYVQARIQEHNEGGEDGIAIDV